MSLHHSLHPFFFEYDLPHWPRRLLDQNFGIAVTPDDLDAAATSPVIPRFKTWWPKDVRRPSMIAEKDKWSINVDVQHFAPDEISVKIANGFIVIEGKHEEKQDEHGFVSRQFVRRFKLPEDSNPDVVESRLSSDGVLTIVAPKKTDLPQGERSVPITHTGPVRKDVSEDFIKTEVTKEGIKEETKEEAKEEKKDETKEEKKEETKEEKKEETKEEKKEETKEEKKEETKEEK
ncbi:hypothetical protein K1T71_013318 [Dendrolimus kikuchii]|uniref:Uncharacterized protein n=1 Tax=Dendrolimus kikuchii TaxID=765133 RepID=A0ACC1CHR6_9NEOP|nr:hypothetical protein K1T71_013318 [Dendrolimus kikuchii]